MTNYTNYEIVKKKHHKKYFYFSILFKNAVEYKEQILDISFIKKTLKTMYSYCERGRLSADMTCNLARLLRLFVAVEIDKFNAILWNKTDRIQFRLLQTLPEQMKDLHKLL
ncbi:hypothetical protein NL108_018730 [Boleophthalmus pectinirostris]|nr:hypothetical protein NL108_018730 [Boleophthalmus pectinirostris]